MKRLLAFVTLCLPIYILAQGFGSFTHDQPYFAKDLSAAAPLPGEAPVLAYWWHSADISSNDPVAVWTDRVSGLDLIQTNSWYKPTNSVNGVCFDGSKSMEFEASMKIPTNSSVFVSGYFSSVPHNQIILYSTNNEGVLSIDVTNQFSVYYANSNRIISANSLSNFVTVGYTTSTSATNTNSISLVAYFNGSQTFSNFFTGTNSSFDFFGGWSGKNIGQTWQDLDYALYAYITDIFIWTNAVLNANNMIYLDALVSTNEATLAPFFDPNSVSGLWTWMRADNPSITVNNSTIITNNGPIQFIPDSCNLAALTTKKYSGTTGGGGSSPPVWSQSLGPNSRPAFAWLASKGILAHSDSVAHAQPFTLFFAMKSTNTVANQAFMDTSVGDRIAIYTTSGGGAEMITYAGSIAHFNLPQSYSNYTVFTVTFNGNSSFVRTNGVELAITSGGVGAGQLTKPRIGLDIADSSEIQGFVTDLLIYDGLPATNDMANIENWLKAKTGL